MGADKNRNFFYCLQTSLLVIDDVSVAAPWRRRETEYVCGQKSYRWSPRPNTHLPFPPSPSKFQVPRSGQIPELVSRSWMTGQLPLKMTNFWGEKCFFCCSNSTLTMSIIWCKFWFNCDVFSFPPPLSPLLPLVLRYGDQMFSGKNVGIYISSILVFRSTKAIEWKRGPEVEKSERKTEWTNCTRKEFVLRIWKCVSTSLLNPRHSTSSVGLQNARPGGKYFFTALSSAFLLLSRRTDRNLKIVEVLRYTNLTISIHISLSGSSERNE